MGRRASKAARSGALVFMTHSHNTCRKAVPVIDANSYLAFQQVQRDLMQRSRHDALDRPDRLPAAPHLDHAIRLQLSRSLRRLAEIIQPDGTIMTVPLPAPR